MSKNTGYALRSKRPRIGITMRFSEKGDFYLRREYNEAIEAAGGIPLLIPLIPNEEFVAELSSELDGLMLPGSDSDVDPLLYSDEPRPGLGRVEPRRDAMDLLLLAEAEKKGLPILGICFGLQSLNVARGGQLVQDIETEVRHPLAHRQVGPHTRRSHYISIEADSLLSKLSGSAVKIAVNSHHHQSVLSAGENLKVTARSSDGVIEAVEDTRKNRFVLGVQWHPELDWENDILSQAVFGAFLAAAAEYRAAS